MHTCDFSLSIQHSNSFHFPSFSTAQFFYVLIFLSIKPHGMNTAQLQPKLNKGTYVDMYNIPKSSGKLQHICMCHLQHLRSTKALTQSSLGDKNNNKQLPKIRQKFPQQRGKSRRRENGESGKKVGGECTGEIHRLRAALNVSPQPIADVNTCMAPPKKKGNGSPTQSHTLRLKIGRHFREWVNFGKRCDSCPLFRRLIACRMRSITKCQNCPANSFQFQSTFPITLFIVLPVNCINL